MGSTTRDAIAATRAALAASAGSVDLATAEELLAAGRIIGGNPQLLALVSEPAADPDTKAAALRSVFGGSLGGTALELLTAAVRNRWSSPTDLLAGVEELGIRAAALSAGPGAEIEGELFAFGKAVSGNAELELAIGSKLGDNASKDALVEQLLAGTASPQALAIVRHLVQQPRGRRINALVSEAAAIVADQAGYAIATVTTASPLTPEQLSRLQTGLGTARPVKINQVVDPTLIGGVRVQIGDEIIDGSVSTRLNDLRLQLAG